MSRPIRRAYDVNGITYNYEYDSLHRLISEIGTGNYTVTASMAMAYGCNDAGHLNAVTDIDLNGANRTFSYDLNGNMTAGSNTTIYVNDLYEIINAAATKYIFAGNLRIAKISGTDIKYFHKDHLGSSTVMTGASGLSVETSEYMPYGGNRDQSGTSVSDYRFTDQELDTSTGLYNYDARLYDPVIGRFIPPDSIVPEPFDPQSVNGNEKCTKNGKIKVYHPGVH